MGVKAAGFIMLLGFMFGSMMVVSRFMLEQFDPVTFSVARF